MQRGRILVDGVDVRDWDLAALRRRTAVVLQDVFLFNGSVADNITLGRTDIPRERVEAAARAVNADGFMRRLGGYDAEVRERGSNLSGGQRQLLAFARALAHDPAILILDEATSSVDPETEWLIQDALEKLLARRTAVVIAHRLSTIESADRILVVHKDELREEGTHAELLAPRRHLCAALPPPVRGRESRARALRGGGRGDDPPRRASLARAVLLAPWPCFWPSAVAARSPSTWHGSGGPRRRSCGAASRSRRCWIAAEVDPALRERLELVLAAREFARDRLGFHVGDSYGTYARVAHGGGDGARRVGRVPRSPRAQAWWYPIAGRVPYRGFFTIEDARRGGGAAGARTASTSTCGRASAFSTLGWFADPLLSTTAAEGAVPLVATVLHELFHQTLYVPGSSAFNESAANFAGERGAIAFFCERARAPARDAAGRRGRPGARPARGAGCSGAWRGRLRRLYACRPAARPSGSATLGRMPPRRPRVTSSGAGSEGRPTCSRPTTPACWARCSMLTRLDEFEALAPGDAAIPGRRCAA